MYIVGIDIAKRFHEAAIHVINPLQSDALIVAEVIRFGRYCETQVAPYRACLSQNACHHFRRPS